MKYHLIINILFFIFLGTFTESKGQGNLYLDSTKISPANATEDDSIVLWLFTQTPTVGKKYAVHHNVTPGNIWVNSCYRITGLAGHTYYTDSIQLGKLPQGKYYINFTGRIGFDTMCNNSWDSVKVIDSFVVHAPVSIQHLFSETVLVYPNPVENTLHLQIANVNSLKSICINDLFGRLVKCEWVSDKINLANLAPGLYYLVIETGSERISKKIIKQ